MCCRSRSGSSTTSSSPGAATVMAATRCCGLRVDPRFNEFGSLAAENRHLREHIRELEAAVGKLMEAARKG